METKQYNCWNDVGKDVNGKVDLIMLNNIVRVQKDYNVDLNDALSKGQLISKAWLVTALEKHFLYDQLDIIVCGGWYGTLSAIIYSNLLHMPTIKSIDVDPNCAAVANALNAERWALGLFEAVTEDMYLADYSRYNLVINTSCEHIPDMELWLSRIPSGTTLLLQSNNFVGGDGHINCVNSPGEIAGNKVFVIESAELILPDYTRFMVLCQKL